MCCGSFLVELIEVIVIADLIYMVMGVIIKNLKHKEETGSKLSLSIKCRLWAQLGFL